MRPPTDPRARLSHEQYGHCCACGLWDVVEAALCRVVNERRAVKEPNTLAVAEHQLAVAREQAERYLGYIADCVDDAFAQVEREARGGAAPLASAPPVVPSPPEPERP